MDVTTWLAHYRNAWISADPHRLSTLFTPWASYRSFAFTEPHVGQQAIAGYWRLATADQADVEVRFGDPVVMGDRVCVEFWTTMRTRDDGPVTLVGVLVLQFERDRCTDLREYWHLEPGRHEPPRGWGR